MGENSKTRIVCIDLFLKHISYIYLCFPPVPLTALASALFLPVTGLLVYFWCISRLAKIVPFLYILEGVCKSSKHKDSLRNLSDVLYMPTAKHLGFKYPRSDLHAHNYWVNKIYDYPEFVIEKLLADKNCQVFNG